MQYKTDVRRFMRGEPGQLSSFATRLCGRYVLSLKEPFLLYSFNFGNQFANQILGLPYTREVRSLKIESSKKGACSLNSTLYLSLQLQILNLLPGWQRLHDALRDPMCNSYDKFLVIFDKLSVELPWEFKLLFVGPWAQTNWHSVPLGFSVFVDLSDLDCLLFTFERR